MDFSPKSQFLKNTTDREAWAQMASEPILHRAISYSLATMVASGLSPDALAGVNGFLFVFLNLSEESPLPRSMPSKHLQSFGQPTTTVKEV
jgi:hypothetical protein